MTSAPPPFDDGGALPDPAIDDGKPAGRGPDTPNYFVRRAVAVGAVVAVLAGASVVAGRLIGGDDGGDPSAPDAADWNTIVVVADDAVRTVDPDSGEVIDTFPADEPLLDAQSLATGDTLVAMNDFGRITQLDLTDGTIRRSSAVEASTLVLSEQNSSIVLAGPQAGGDVTVVDTRDGRSFDIGEVADLADPLIFAAAVLVSPSGSHVATADAGSFQSVLIDLETQTPILLAGQVVALDNDTVVTVQRAGDRAEFEFYDLQGERRGAADAASPRVTMLTDESTVLIVDAAGTISSIAADGDVESLGVITPPADGDGTVEVRGGVAFSATERLLVAVDDGFSLLDPVGLELARLPGDLLSPITAATTCVLVGDTRPTGAVLHVDVTAGEKLGELPGGFVASASADGCVAALVGTDPLIVNRGALVVGPHADPESLASGSITIAPDGTSFVRATPGGEQLVALHQDENNTVEPVDLADERVLIRFAKL